MENKMYCFQCQETAGAIACTQVGVCGKKPKTANLQDMLIYTTKGLAEVLTVFRQQKKLIDSTINHLVNDNLFTTITNANFDDSKILERIYNTLQIKMELINEIDEGLLSKDALWFSNNLDTIFEKSSIVGVLSTTDEDIRSLRELIIYGLKGMAAYNKHANTLHRHNDDVDAFMQKALAMTLDDQLSVEELIALTLETGKYGVDAMSLLDTANTSAYGNPEITNVNIGVSNKPAILISGHDLRDLEMLLKQTEGTGVDVYTHSEMLPAHYYPFFKKYKHLVGNYGNAWWKQKEEFESFNGPILFTTNCLVPPKASYIDRIYTTGNVGFDGCKHIDGKIGEVKDFSIIIEHAKRLPAPTQIESGEIVGGFAHSQVLTLADTIVEAIESGAIKKFVVMAGCDGRSKSRDYYQDFAKSLPQDSVILTAGCAKYRYNKLDLGDIGGIPRVLDAGQCNDSYSLALIALKLKEVFGFEDINDLPIIYNIAWYEQKAVIVLLALLHLGVKDIHLGPTLPAFLSPNVVQVLVNTFGIAGIQTVEEDIEAFFPETKIKNTGEITKNMTISDILRMKAEAADILIQHGMGCLGCPASQEESLEEACIIHDLDITVLLTALNK